MPYHAVSMLSADRFYAVLGCFRMFFEMNWICLGPLVSIDKIKKYLKNYYSKSYPLLTTIFTEAKHCKVIHVWCKFIQFA